VETHNKRIFKGKHNVSSLQLSTKFQGSLSKLAPGNGSAKDTSHNTPEDEDDAITINVLKASPDDNKTSSEQQPLLHKRKSDGTDA
jgi:hypothetical protein